MLPLGPPAEAVASPGSCGSEIPNCHKDNQTEDLSPPSKWINVIRFISYCMCIGKDRD